MINSQHESLCREMIGAGAEVVLIDGAIDRKSIAAPETSDAIILSTGAVISRQMNTVIEETAHTVGLYRLPRLEEGPVREGLEKFRDDDKILLAEGGEIRHLDLRTGLGAGKILAATIGKDVSHVFLPGAFTPGSIDGIDPRTMRELTFVLKDPTKIFFPPSLWRKMCKWGLNVKVLENINVAAVTVNPTSPQGYRFDQQQLVEGVQRALPDIPVIDVMA